MYGRVCILRATTQTMPWSTGSSTSYNRGQRRCASAHRSCCWIISFNMHSLEQKFRDICKAKLQDKREAPPQGGPSVSVLAVHLGARENVSQYTAFFKNDANACQSWAEFTELQRVAMNEQVAPSGWLCKHPLCLRHLPDTAFQLFMDVFQQAPQLTSVQLYGNAMRQPIPRPFQDVLQNVVQRLQIKCFVRPTNYLPEARHTPIKTLRLNMLRNFKYGSILRPLFEEKPPMEEVCIPMWNLVNTETMQVHPITGTACPKRLAIEPGRPLKSWTPVGVTCMR